MNCYITVTLVIVSLILGYIKYCSLSSSYKNASWQLKFIEFWNDSVNFLIAGFIGYYFISVKIPLLWMGNSLNTGDFFLLILFLFSIFGHLAVISHHITEGVSTLVEKFIKH